MSDSPSENKEKSPTSEPMLKNASSTEMYAKIDFETVFFTAKKYSRSASAATFPSEKVAQTVTKEVLLAVNSLSSEGLFALETMKKLGAFELSSREISLSQVKKAFRRLCLVYHPDKIPSSATAADIKAVSLNFSQLKTAKDTLEESFALYNKTADNKAA